MACAAACRRGASHGGPFCGVHCFTSPHACVRRDWLASRDDLALPLRTRHHAPSCLAGVCRRELRAGRLRRRRWRQRGNAAASTRARTRTAGGVDLRPGRLCGRCARACQPGPRRRGDLRRTRQLRTRGRADVEQPADAGLRRALARHAGEQLLLAHWLERQQPEPAGSMRPATTGAASARTLQPDTRASMPSLTAGWPAMGIAPT